MCKIILITFLLMELCQLKINVMRESQLFETTPGIKHVITVNAETFHKIRKDSRLKQIINNNLATIDGQIPLWLFKCKHKGTSITKIPGSQLIYSVSQWAADNNKKVFLLGGKEPSNALAVVKLREKYRVSIKGFSPAFENYPFKSETNLRILEQINEFAPDVLFVGFGMGKQEYWIDDFKDELEHTGVKLVIGCGGSFEFASGIIKRAPVLFQKAGLEGVWRLVSEPKWFRVKRLFISFGIFYYFLQDILSPQ